MDSREPLRVIFFDGECGFCEYWVNWIIDHDHKRVFQFSSRDSAYAKRKLPAMDVDSIFLLEGSRVSTQSTAVLRICKQLPIPWKLLYVLMIIPQTLRDRIYQWVASCRHTFFSQAPTCRRPSDEIRKRFLEE